MTPKVERHDETTTLCLTFSTVEIDEVSGRPCVISAWINCDTASGLLSALQAAGVKPLPRKVIPRVEILEILREKEFNVMAAMAVLEAKYTLAYHEAAKAINDAIPTKAQVKAIAASCGYNYSKTVLVVCDRYGLYKPDAKAAIARAEDIEWKE